MFGKFYGVWCRLWSVVRCASAIHDHKLQYVDCCVIRILYFLYLYLHSNMANNLVETIENTRRKVHKSCAISKSIMKNLRPFLDRAMRKERYTDLVHIKWESTYFVANIPIELFASLVNGRILTHLVFLQKKHCPRWRISKDTSGIAFDVCSFTAVGASTSGKKHIQRNLHASREIVQWKFEKARARTLRAQDSDRWIPWTHCIAESQSSLDFPLIQWSYAKWSKTHKRSIGMDTRIKRNLTCAAAWFKRSWHNRQFFQNFEILLQRPNYKVREFQL